jgi:hypothetical protein
MPGKFQEPTEKDTPSTCMSINKKKHLNPHTTLTSFSFETCVHYTLNPKPMQFKVMQIIFRFYLNKHYKAHNMKA